MQTGTMMLPRFLLRQQLVVLLGCLVALSSASNEITRGMYPIRQPNEGKHRENLQILDLGTFLLTNSEDGRPKEMAPFYVNIFETQDNLSEDSLIQVEEATNAFLRKELDAVYTSSDRVASVRSLIVHQDRVVTNVGDRRRGLLRRQLASVPGAKMRMHVNVTFDREPSPDAAYVDDKLQAIMRDLTHLVSNITATDDTSLDGVFLAYREEINTYYEAPTVSIEKPEPPQEKSSNISYLVPAIVGLVLVAAIIAMLIVKRRRQREEEANLKVQEDLAFLDEEANMFSFENSPTKSNKKSFQDDQEYEDGDSSHSSNIHEDEDDVSRESDQYPSVSSPTARSMMSGASTVKVSNARAVPTQSKLSELASTSLFAFSEEDDEDLESTSDNSQHTPVSAAPSVASKDSSVFNRIMNSTPEDFAKSTPVSSPAANSEAEKEDASSTPNTPGGGAGTPRSIASSIFSSIFVSNDNNSHFAGSVVTEMVDNTTEGLIRRSTNNAARTRSVSCSPRVLNGGQRAVISPPSFTRSPARSVGGNEEDVDSVFDFLSVASPNPNKANDSKTKDANSTADESDLAALELDSLNGSLNATLNRVDEENTEKVQANDDSKSENAQFADSPSKASVGSRHSSPSKSSPKKSSPSKASPMKTSSPTKSASPSKSAVVKSPESSHMVQQNISDKAALSPASAAKKRNSDDDEGSFDSSFFSDDMDSRGAFPRRSSRRHAKSTTQDGTAAYQTNAMQPNDWSMTDGLSDDDTLSEHGGSGAFPIRSPKNRKSDERSVDRSEKSSRSAGVTSPTSKAGEEASQASSSRQLINDLVWLSKKIAGVKQSAVATAPGEAPLGAPPQIDTVDSLSYASQDNMASPMSENADKKLLSSPPSQSSNTNANTPGGHSASVVCQDCVAPPGKLNIVIHSTKDGPAVHEVKQGSSLKGKIYPGDLIIAVDDVDTRSFTAAQLMKMMTEKTQCERKITVLHFDDEDKES